MNTTEQQYLRLKCLEIAMTLGYHEPHMISKAQNLYKYVIYGEPS